MMDTERISGSARTVRLKPAACGCLLLVASTTLVAAQDLDAASTTLVPISLGKVFTFLFLSLGPANIVGPFMQMTRGRDQAFKRRLAAQGILIAAIALLVAATLGAWTLADWGVSAAALFITVGILLSLVGFQLVMAQYRSQASQAEPPSLDTAPTSSSFSLAFSPLAFPTIVTPYGIGVLVLAMTLASEETPGVFSILAIAALVLALDLLVMWALDLLLKAPLVVAAFGIVASVMAVLQIALGIQAILVGLRLSGFIAANV
jgi:multiple antibiotic resistance protein